MSKNNTMSLMFEPDHEDFNAESMPLINTVRTDKFYVGIDNGVSGIIAIINPDHKVIFRKIPTKSEQSYTKKKQNITRIDVNKLVRFLEDSLPTVTENDRQLIRVVIERPMVNPGRLKSTFSALRSLEAVLIVVDDILQLPFSYIDSREWQKELLPRGVEGPDLKTASLQIANRLFPQWREHKHPDRDGLLIAEYARRSNL